MLKRIVDITADFFECAMVKRTELQSKRADFVALLRQGNYDEVLRIISTHLAQNSDDGIFPGLISDYKIGDVLKPSEDVIQRIDSTLEVCQQRIDSFNKEMLDSWMKDTEKRLGKSLQITFAEVDQLARNVWEKIPVKTNRQKLEDKIVEQATTIENI